MPITIRNRFHDYAVFNPIFSREIEREVEMLENEVNRTALVLTSRKPPSSFAEVVLGKKDDLHIIDNTVPGDLVLREQKEILSHFPFHRAQEQFIEMFVQSSLQNIYKDDFYDHEYRIRMENNIDYLYMHTLLCCSRRLGKTFASSAFTAAAAVAIPSLNITIFSPSKRQSQLFMRQVKVHLAAIRSWGYDFTVVKGQNNQECFAIARNGTVRRITGLPGKEEVSFMK